MNGRRPRGSLGTTFNVNVTLCVALSACHICGFCAGSTCTANKVKPVTLAQDACSQTMCARHQFVPIATELTPHKILLPYRGSTSPSLPVSSGVPQGSILGPLLFLIYINGVTDIPLSISSQLTLYADDIFIFRPISSPSVMSLLQRDLDSISSWLTSHLLQLNSSKSKYIIFSRKSPSLFDGFPSLEISSSSIERVSSFRYLGVLLTPTLTWTPHISAICCKSRRILGIIFRHFHPYSSASTIIRLLVHPHLEYCSAIWAPSSPSLCHSIESVQNFALKLASKFRPSLKSSLQSSFNLPNLSTRRLYSKLLLIF